MRVYFYYNQKRYKSTANPPQAAFYSDCVFKDPTSLINPVIILNFSGKPAVNYFSIDNRYYWITDIITLNNNRWEIHGTVDVLSTYSKHIKNTHAFVLYDSTPNTQLPDNRLAIQTDCNAYTATANMPWNFDAGTGTYFICTTGNSDEVNLYTATVTQNALEGTGVYILPKNQIDKLGFDGGDIASAILSSFNTWNAQMAAAFSHAQAQDPANDPFGWLGAWLQYVGTAMWSGIAAGLDFFKIIGTQLLGGGSALSNIKAAYWLPFVIPAAASVATSKPLALGSYKDTVSGLRRVDDPVITSAWVSVAIPWHFSDWRNVSCTEVMLYIPMIGCINIPSEVVKGNNNIQVRIALNLYSGSMACEVRCDSADLGTYGANVSMPYLIGDSNMNVGGIVNTITAGASSNPIGAVAGAAQSLTPMATSVGGIGGGAGTGLGNDIVCICRVHETSQNPSALIDIIGTPTNKLKLLSGTGYCQTLNAQLNCNSQSNEPEPTQTEIDLVNSLLDSGIYLEDTSGGGVILVPKTITANGVYNASSDNADGYNEVTVNVPGPVLATKNITANGTYLASSDNVDGFDEVVVNVTTSISKTLLHTLTQAQGGVWISTGVNITDIDILMFESVIDIPVENTTNMQVLLKPSQIAANSGSINNYTKVFVQYWGDKQMNAAILDGVLYVSYATNGPANRYTNVYSLDINDYI